MKKIYLLLGLLLLVNFSGLFSQFTINCPGNQTLYQRGGTDPIYYYSVTATDDFYGHIDPYLVEGLKPGSAFPLGTTKVTWEADGRCGPFGTQICPATCTFYVTVLPSDESAHSYFYYYDLDKDGYGNDEFSNIGIYGLVTTSPTPPAGYVDNHSDCNDHDPTVWQSIYLYIDNDGDGFTNGIDNSHKVCVGNTPPLGYAITSRGQDCNDNDASEYQMTTFYKDEDGDGYNDGSIQVCGGVVISPPPGYVFFTNGHDCNDDDKNIHAPLTCYPDGDKDGFGNPQLPVSVCALSPP